jgi:SAM-dependent methyltransferase
MTALVRDGDVGNMPPRLGSWSDQSRAMEEHIVRYAEGKERIEILEAGCGNKWSLELGDVRFRLTGVDLDEDALDIRKNTKKDLDVAIVGDLLDVDLEDEAFDVIYSSYVLEHVGGAERVLENFVRWLRPGGLIILRIPNRDSAKGFLTRVTPFSLHVFYKRHIEGLPEAGTPGHAPYCTPFDRIVSRRGIHDFCRRRSLELVAEYEIGYGSIKNPLKLFAIMTVMGAVSALSLGRLSARLGNLIYVIEKPVEFGMMDSEEC